MKKAALILLTALPAFAQAGDGSPSRQHFIDQVAQCAAWFGLNGLVGPHDVDAHPDPESDPQIAVALDLALGKLLDGDLDRVDKYFGGALDRIIADAARAPGNDEQRLQAIADHYAPDCRIVYRNLDDNMVKWAQ
jgi:hypothetical protein